MRKVERSGCEKREAAFCDLRAGAQKLESPLALLSEVCSEPAAASVGCLGDLLAGGDHLPILDFLKDCADLAGGDRHCSGEGGNRYLQGSKEKAS